MLTLAITLLTAVLVFICFLLVILILMQLPKKDAGAGLAFGGGAAEAIFGAGAGTPLAQITKYCAGLFLCLALVLSALNAQRSNEPARLIEEEAARAAEESSSATLKPAKPETEEPIVSDSGETEPEPVEPDESESTEPAEPETESSPELSAPTEEPAESEVTP